MNVHFRESFARDLANVGGQSLRDRIATIIRHVEEASDLRDLPGLKRLSGGRNYYRLRVGDYRLGFVIVGDSVTFVRFLHRREIYRHFP